MASRPIPSWFDNLPSWIQSGRDSCNTNQYDSSRVSSIISASTRTKTKSRAEAMRKLEGRKLSEPTTIASTRAQDSESEGEDPWTDPWQWQRPPCARRSSSVYSQAQELQTVHKYLDEQIQNPFTEEDRANSKKPDFPKHIENPFIEEDHSSQDQKHDLELQVRTALRQSHSTAGYSELTHPPKAYSVVSRKFSLTPSDSPYRLSWLHTSHGPDDGVQKTWRGASRSYDPESWRGMDENVKALGWNWTRSIVDAPKSVYQSSIDLKPNLGPSYPGSERPILKDSGLRDASAHLGWLHSVCAFLVFFNTWGIVCTFGAFRSYYGQVLLPNTSRSSLSWIGSTQLAMLFLAMVPAGQVVARGYFRFSFLAGTTFLVTGIFSASWCSSLGTIWLTQGLIAGVGIGMVFGSASALAMQQYGKVVTRLQLSVLGAPTGGLCYILLARTLMTSYGPRTAMPIMAMMIALTITLPLVVLSKAALCFSGPSNDFGSRVEGEDWKRWHRFDSTLYLGMVIGGLFFVSQGAYFGLFHLDSGALLPLQASMSPKLLLAALIAGMPGCLLLAVLRRQVTCSQCLPAVAMLNSCVMWLWLGLTHKLETSMVIACLYGLLLPGIPMLCIPAVYSLCVEPATKVDRELLKARSSDVAWAFRPYERRACVMFICMGVACLVGTPICGALLDNAMQRESLQRPYLA